MSGTSCPDSVGKPTLGGAELVELSGAVASVLVEAADRRASSEWIANQLMRLQWGGWEHWLIPHIEPFDGSISHDVLLHRPGHPALSIGLGGSTGLPWPLRAMVRAHDRDVVRLDGTTLSVGDVIRTLEHRLPAQEWTRLLLRSAVVADELRRRSIRATPAMVQEAADRFRRAHKLYTAEETEAWLSDRGLTSAHFVEMVEGIAEVGELRRQAVAHLVTEMFATRVGRLDILTVAYLDETLGTAAELRDNPWQAIRRVRLAGGTGAISDWPVMDLPLGTRHLAHEEVGTDHRILVDGSPKLCVIVDRITARDDPRSRLAIEQELFDEWLDERSANRDIQWWWAPGQTTSNGHSLHDHAGRAEAARGQA